MSVRSDLIEIKCDGPDAATDCPESRAWSDYGPASDLRRRMRTDGWETARPGGIDRCELCRTQPATGSGSDPSGGASS